MRTSQLNVEKGRIPLDNDTVLKMLSALCKSSSEFKRYYTDHKQSIEKLHLKWYIDATLKNKKGYASPLTMEITLSNYPKSQEDGRIVAHEIEHLLIWNRGYPYVTVDPHDMLGPHKDPTIRNLGISIQGMIFEPMVEMRIKDYFENLCQSHQKNAINWLSKLTKNKNDILVEINSPRALLYYSCLYVKNRLLIEVTGESNDSNEYARLFNENFGDSIAPCAEKILALIKTNAPITPTSVKIILERLLQCKKFDLSYQEQVTFNRFVIKSRAHSE